MDVDMMGVVMLARTVGLCFFCCFIFPTWGINAPPSQAELPTWLSTAKAEPVQIVSAKADVKTIFVCDDAAEWPPYVFYERNKKGSATPLISGASITALSQIFKNAGYRMEIRLLPWKRCLKEVDEFDSRRQFEMFSNGSVNAHRMRNYLPTDPFYTTTEGFFYDGRRFPDGLNLHNIEELNQYKICGVAGYNYEHYRIAGLKTKIDTGAYTTYQALLKMVSQRCDLVLSQLEPILGAEQLGLYDLPLMIRHMPLKSGKKVTFHMWISRQSPRGKELVKMINDGLRTLRKQCKYETYYTPYIQRGSGLEPIKECQ